MGVYLLEDFRDADTGALEETILTQWSRMRLTLVRLKRGWEWLGLEPAVHGRISGLPEAPDLAACLTPSTNDFIREPNDAEDHPNRHDRA
jgi:hypothetical protein